MALPLAWLPAVALLACNSGEPPPTAQLPAGPVGAKDATETAASATDAGTCDSSRHESSSLEGVYTFDLACALTWLADAGCDFGLDPDANGSALSSSIIEDLQNDSANCQSGTRCSGCTDSDSIDTITSCEELAGISYFTENAWSDLQAACPSESGISCEGGSWSSGGDSVALDAEQECMVLEIANWATRGQLTEVELYTGTFSPSVGLTATQATAVTQRATTVTYIREYDSIDTLLAQPDLGIDALTHLRDYISSWEANGRMGDSELSAEDRLMLFVNSDEVVADELDYIEYLSSESAAAIVAARPMDAYADLVTAVGGTVHWVEPGGSLYDYAQEWYATSVGSEDLEGTGCTIEGVAYSYAEMTTATNFFTSMTCEQCTDLLDSRICEDAINDASTCQSGSACTGCTDGDGRDNGVDCDEIAAYSYFGPSAAETLLAWAQDNPGGEASCTPDCTDKTCGEDGCGGSCGSCGTDATCDTSGQCSGDACTIEGVVFEGDDMDCALWFFEQMSCDQCRDVFDSRICEDAINDASSCQAGSTCTGCTDADDRSDGVECDEIAAYSYFGSSAASALLEFVQADGSCGEPELVVEGIPLDDDQASGILEVANGASETQLDDEAGLDSRAATNIVAERPFTDVSTLAEVSYVGATVIQALLDYSTTWVPEDEAPLSTTITTLADEASSYGTTSSYYDALVTVERVIVTSEPTTYSSGATAFWAADPSAGYVEDLWVYITADATVSTSSLSIFDEIEITGQFTSYGSTFEILLDSTATHALSISSSGLAYEDYETVQGAWTSTSSNPEGSVRVVADFGYTYMVPLPIFSDHPMWGGVEPDPPAQSGSEQDYNWNIAAQDALDDWLAGL